MSGTVLMRGADIGGRLALNGTRLFALAGARVEGQVILDGATFSN